MQDGHTVFRITQPTSFYDTCVRAMYVRAMYVRAYMCVCLYARVHASVRACMYRAVPSTLRRMLAEAVLVCGVAALAAAVAGAEDGDRAAAPPVSDQAERHLPAAPRDPPESHGMVLLHYSLREAFERQGICNTCHKAMGTGVVVIQL